MEVHPQQVTLSTLANGAADELFIDALGQVLKNIEDQNTDFKAERQIILKFSIRCDEERRVGNIAVQCSTKLAGVKGLSVGVYFGHQDGLPVAVEAPRQEDLFPNPKNRPYPVAAQGA